MRLAIADADGRAAPPEPGGAGASGHALCAVRPAGPRLQSGRGAGGGRVLQVDQRSAIRHGDRGGTAQRCDTRAAAARASGRRRRLPEERAGRLGLCRRRDPDGA
ncbi:hypothetical protein G6F22_019261 [Rhizopus arrhizus]|nr:hypothetical protein G6F22_019261 [Rhizopus arrhizus]KAG1167911.1 hypothetical protein G6F35_017582 [Rhizopus arrhizus]